MHQGAPECTERHFAGLEAAESAPGCSISAPECGCGKALEALRGKVGEALAALDEGRVDDARAMLCTAMAIFDAESALPAATP